MGKLLDWFGAGRRESWRQLGAEIGGRFTPGTWRRRQRLDVPHAHWTITLDTSVLHANNVHVPFTRCRAPFLASSSFRCRISRANVFTRIGHWLGVQDLAVGDPAFDRAFVVRSSAADTVRAFCQERPLRQLLLAEKAITLSVQDHEGWFGPRFPTDTDELCVEVVGHLQDPPRLRALVQLLATALDRLVAIGVADAAPPRFRL